MEDEVEARPLLLFKILKYMTFTSSLTAWHLYISWTLSHWLRPTTLCTFKPPCLCTCCSWCLAHLPHLYYSSPPCHIAGLKWHLSFEARTSGSLLGLLLVHVHLSLNTHVLHLGRQSTVVNSGPLAWITAFHLALCDFELGRLFVPQSSHLKNGNSSSTYLLI